MGLEPPHWELGRTGNPTNIRNDNSEADNLMARPRKGTEQIRMAERRREALELKRAGVSYEEISNRLGYGNRANAYRDVQSAIADLTKQPTVDLLAEELDRLDALLIGVWPKAVKGDPAAVDRVLRIMERRAKYRGLDQAQPISLEGVMRYVIEGVDVSKVLGVTLDRDSDT